MRRSLRSSQRTAQWPRWCRKATKAASKSSPRGADRLLELARRAGEQALAVGQHDQLVGVAVGLLDVVGGVDARSCPRPRAAG